MRYHHLGIPPTQARPGEEYLADYRAYCTCGVRWGARGVLAVG